MPTSLLTAPRIRKPNDSSVIGTCRVIFALVLFKNKNFYTSESDVKIADRTLFIVGVLVFHEKD